MRRASPWHPIAGFLLSVSVATLIAAGNSTAAQLLTYQGRLEEPTTGASKPDGTYPMVFRVYGAPTGGTPLWTESKTIAVSGGIFSTRLGDTTVLDPALFDGSDRWLGVTIGSDPEAVPRTLLTHTPYAFHALDAGTLNGFDETSFASAGPLFVERSYAGGASNSVRNDAQSPAFVGLSKLSGPVTGQVICANVHDNGFTAHTSTCP